MITRYYSDEQLAIKSYKRRLNRAIWKAKDELSNVAYASYLDNVISRVLQMTQKERLHKRKSRNKNKPIYKNLLIPDSCFIGTKKSLNTTKSNLLPFGD